MGKGKSADILFPVNGVASVASRENTPDGTVTPEMMLNMLPHDRAGRKRGGVRPGTAKLFAAAMGNGSQAVTGMIQTTLALDPSNLVADQQLVNETFSYGTTGGLGVVAPTTWKIRGNNNGFSGSVDNTLIAIPASHDRANLARNGGAGANAIYLPSLTLGSAYIVKMKVAWPTTVAGQASVNVRGLDGSLSAIGAYWDGTTTLRLKDFAVGDIATATVPVAVSATYYTLEIQVNGNAFKVLLNGTLYISATSSQYAGQSAVGFGGVTGSSSGIDVDDFQVFTGKAPASLRQTNIVSVCGGNVYQGLGDGTNAITTNGASALSTTVLASMAYTAGIVYMVDGFVVKQLNLTTQTVSSVVATAGSLPANCTLACLYRDRLVLAAPRGTPQNFYMSRVAVPTDYDYSQVDTAAAFAGNASTAGHIGEPIVALIPFSDDQLLIGGDHNLWMVRGDPADGGSIDLVSDATGILGAAAWCKAPDGTVYIAGTGGLFKFAPGSAIPTNVSREKDNEFFRAINRGSQYITLAWDRDRQGCYVFVTPANSGTGATHRWFDGRTEGFFPIQYPDNHGPLCAIVYDGDAATDRALLLGGRTGFVQQVQDAALTDDGTTINGFFAHGPIRTYGDCSEAKMTHVDVILGDLPSGIAAGAFQCTLSVRTGNTAYMASNAPRQTMSKTFTTPNRQTRWLMRTRGVEYYFQFQANTSGKTFTFEKAVAYFEFGGRERR